LIAISLKVIFERYLYRRYYSKHDASQFLRNLIYIESRKGVEIITQMKNAGSRKLSCNGPRAWHEIMKGTIFLSVLSSKRTLWPAGGYKFRPTPKLEEHETRN